MIRIIRRTAIVGAAVLIAACAPASSGGPGSRAAQHNVVTADELAPMRTLTVYDALQRIRPTFLRSRAVATETTPNPPLPTVFIDGVRTEGLDALRQVHADEVRVIRFYEPQDANTRFGTGNDGGAIEVTLRH
jgi:hypothetical protein